MIYKATVTDLVRAINLWNGDYSLGLRDLGARDDKAAWGVGNRLVTIARLTPMQGEPLARFEYVNYNGESPNAEADLARQTLIELLKKHFVELPLSDYPRGESSRIANTTLEKKHAKQAWLAELREREPNLTESDIYTRWAQIPKRPKLTEKQAAAAFFDSLPTPSAALDAPALPTSDAGNGQAEPTEKREPGHAGRPGLEVDHNDLIYRLAKAQEAEEIRQADNKQAWKEIAKAIGWRYGCAKSGVKLLEDARKRLKRADADTLAEVAEYRRKEKTKKT